MLEEIGNDFITASQFSVRFNLDEEKSLELLNLGAKKKIFIAGFCFESNIHSLRLILFGMLSRWYQWN